MKNKNDPIQNKKFITATLVVRVDKTYRSGMSAAQAYDCARWAWKANLARASNCGLVLAVYKGKVIGAYRPTKWDVAVNIKPPQGKSAKQIAQDVKEKRVAFEGVDISKSSPFVGRNIVMWQNPIRYL